jgi:hypothetical protein
MDRFTGDIGGEGMQEGASPEDSGGQSERMKPKASNLPLEASWVDTWKDGLLRGDSIDKKSLLMTSRSGIALPRAPLSYSSGEAKRLLIFDALRITCHRRRGGGGILASQMPWGEARCTRLACGRAPKPYTLIHAGKQCKRSHPDSCSLFIRGLKRFNRTIEKVKIYHEDPPG